MAIVWFYRSPGGKKQGPVSSAALKQMADNGTLHPSQLVWNDTMVDWEPAETVEGLYAPDRLAELKALPLPTESTSKEARRTKHPKGEMDSKKEGKSSEKRPAPGASSPPRKWFYNLQGKEIGPIEWEDVERMAKLGGLKADSLLRRADRSEWTRASDLLHEVFRETNIETSKRWADPVRPKPATTAEVQFTPLTDTSAAQTTPPASAGVQPPQSTGSMWFYALKGQQMGPVSFPELQKLAVTQVLAPGDLVWTAGLTEWIAAGQVPGLLPK